MTFPDLLIHVLHLRTFLCLLEFSAECSFGSIKLPLPNLNLFPLPTSWECSSLFAASLSLYYLYQTFSLGIITKPPSQGSCEDEQLNTGKLPPRVLPHTHWTPNHNNNSYHYYHYKSVRKGQFVFFKKGVEVRPDVCISLYICIE